MVKQMKKNMKNHAVLAAIIIASFLLGNIYTSAAAPGDSNLLEDVWNYIFGIEENVEELSDEVMILESNLNLLERIHELETRITVLEECGCEDEANGFPQPDYDSGWLYWDRELEGTTMTINHGLNSMDYYVYLIGKYNVVSGEPISPPITDPTHFHTWGYGGDWGYSELTGEFKQGIYYEAYMNSIKIMRANSDPYSDYVRVMIWKIPPIS